MASAKPRATARPRPTPAPRGGVAVPLEGLEDAVLASSGTPGPRSTTRSSTRSPSGAGGTRAAAVGAVLASVLDHVGDDPLQQPGSTATIGRVSRDVQLDAALGDAAQRHRDHLVEVDLADQRGDGAGLQPGHVQQVAHEVVEPVGAVLDAGQQFGLVLLGPGDVVGAQGA